MSKKISFIVGGTTKEVQVLAGEELRIELRAKIQEKYGNKTAQEAIEMIPSSVEEMTYEHALLLADLPPDSSMKMRDSNAKIDAADIVAQDFGEGLTVLFVTVGGTTTSKTGAIKIVDMNAGTGTLAVDFLTGEALKIRLGAIGQQPTHPSGMTARDVLHLLRGEQNQDLLNSPLSDYKTKRPITLDALISPEAAEKGITWIAAKPITGNFLVRMVKQLFQ